ncbi:class I SAM-dependent methyltransferase [Calycomorphotria hydatis]|uniref:Methyltransferase domain protein n=1 Tax=Calycomorphotria hydatis TaxID=2528027 RepID=A0A517T4X3_9PLAN|nr:class I SAM-dependent methyltransferase [Calycomorphotria hydatis]QDT63420.1 Methyltransferase domain protein [Calycomorphotria hydatis]
MTAIANCPSTPRATDWDRYYAQPYRTASFTRTISQQALLERFQKFTQTGGTIAELGGANSCFFEAIHKQQHPQRYHVIDFNARGVDLFRERFGHMPGISAEVGDVLSLNCKDTFDAVLSVGLVEHFDSTGTKQALQSHFELLKPGGVAIITFPTPTPLYRTIRGVAELSNQWIFHDERPLQLSEVRSAIGDAAELLDAQIIWGTLLTQYQTVWRKRG